MVAGAGDGDRQEREVVRAPRGPVLSCKGWQQEAALRMLRNNLDPEVAEHPEELVVYGGSGKAARDWPSFHAIERTLAGLAGDETLLVQSGRPVGVVTTHEWAPRVLIANSNLVPDWATWEEFRRLEALGLTMYGQMTAGSWIYIGTQGILQGTYETFAAVAERRFGGSLAGTLTVTSGAGGMGGAQPLAVTINGGAVICCDVDPTRIERRLSTGYLDTLAHSLDEAIELADRARRRSEALSVGLVGNGAEVLPELVRRDVPVDVATDQTPAHDPLSYVPLGLSLEDAGRLRHEDPAEYLRRARAAMATRSSPSWTGAPRSSTTATACGPRRGWAGSSGRSTTPGSCSPTSVRSSAKARARSAGRPFRATRGTSRRRTPRSSSSSVTTTASCAGSASPASGCGSRACRRASAGSVSASATAPGSGSTRWSPRRRCPRRS